MKKELEDKLYKDFPLLYGDRTKSMRQTCMCWGMECGDGWFDLIYDLSSKLEKEIKRFVKDNPRLRCATCGCEDNRHFGYISRAPGKCLRVKERGRFGVYRSNTKINALFKKYKWLRRPLEYLAHVLNVFCFDYEACWCESYDPRMPRASQVKEKYGSLRFYLTIGTDEMFDYIDKAEEQSETICEVCGKEGKIEPSGWLKCLCKDCED